jgi:hypothetical protein
MRVRDTILASAFALGAIGFLYHDGQRHRQWMQGIETSLRESTSVCLQVPRIEATRPFFREAVQIDIYTPEGRAWYDEVKRRNPHFILPDGNILGQVRYDTPNPEIVGGSAPSGAFACSLR